MNGIKTPPFVQPVEGLRENFSTACLLPLIHEKPGGHMKTIFLAVVISIVGPIHDFSSAADLQVVTVALVSPSWNTGLPTAVARGAGSLRLSKQKCYLGSRTFNMQRPRQDSTHQQSRI
jgi:hypothetical protein